MRSLSFVCAALAGVVVSASFVGAGCGSTRAPDGFAPIDGGDAALEDASDFDAFFGQDVHQRKIGCSADLHDVIDSDGAVLQRCPAEQGCLDGACVPSCQAAAGSKGHLGCDFVVSTPITPHTPPCFAVFVANTWEKPVKLTVSRAGTNYDVTRFGRIPDDTPDAARWPMVPASGLAEGSVAVLFLSGDPTASHPMGGPTICPVEQAVAGATAVIGTGKGRAFHITTDHPVSAYDILPYGGARSFLPSAQLLLPTTAWGSNFVAAFPPPTVGAPWAQIVAAENGTKIQIVPTVALPGGGGLSPAPANQTSTFTLDAGEVAQWLPSGDVSGSIVSSDKPVSFMGGTTNLCLTSATSAGGGCDAAHQTTQPISALGNEYVASPYSTRRADLAAESIRYRFVGAVNGTTLTYDPAVSGAPSALNAGQIVDFETDRPFVVKSQDAQHPFSVAQMMVGCDVTGGSRIGTTPGVNVCAGCLGDEDSVVVVPPAQWLKRYAFFTDPAYGTTTLTFARTKGDSGFKDVTLDCLGTIRGWTAVGASGRFEMATVDLVRRPVITPCKNGGHLAKSEAPFGLVVWGLDGCASYGYPAGGNSANINTVVVPPVPR